VNKQYLFNNLGRVNPFFLLAKPVFYPRPDETSFSKRFFSLAEGEKTPLRVALRGVFLPKKQAREGLGEGVFAVPDRTKPGFSASRKPGFKVRTFPFARFPFRKQTHFASIQPGFGFADQTE
jgi:hypothetical protein